MEPNNPIKKTEKNFFSSYIWPKSGEVGKKERSDSQKRVDKLSKWNLPRMIKKVNRSLTQYVVSFSKPSPVVVAQKMRNEMKAKYDTNPSKYRALGQFHQIIGEAKKSPDFLSRVYPKFQTVLDSGDKASTERINEYFDDLLAFMENVEEYSAIDENQKAQDFYRNHFELLIYLDENYIPIEALSTEFQSAFCEFFSCMNTQVVTDSLPLLQRGEVKPTAKRFLDKVARYQEELESFKTGEVDLTKSMQSLLSNQYTDRSPLLMEKIQWKKEGSLIQAELGFAMPGFAARETTIEFDFSHLNLPEDRHDSLVEVMYKVLNQPTAQLRLLRAIPSIFKKENLTWENIESQLDEKLSGWREGGKQDVRKINETISALKEQFPNLDSDQINDLLLFLSNTALDANQKLLDTMDSVHHPDQPIPEGIRDVTSELFNPDAHQILEGIEHVLEERIVNGDLIRALNVACKDPNIRESLTNLIHSAVKAKITNNENGFGSIQEINKRKENRTFSENLKTLYEKLEQSPLSIFSGTEQEKSVEDLVQVLMSRVQYYTIDQFLALSAEDTATALNISEESNFITAHRTYMDDPFVEKKWVAFLNSKQSPEMQNQSRIRHNQAKWEQFKEIHGRDGSTQNVLSQFESVFAPVLREASESILSEIYANLELMLSEETLERLFSEFLGLAIRNRESNLHRISEGTVISGSTDEDKEAYTKSFEIFMELADPAKDGEKFSDFKTTIDDFCSFKNTQIYNDYWTRALHTEKSGNYKKSRGSELDKLDNDLQWGAREKVLAFHGMHSRGGITTFQRNRWEQVQAEPVEGREGVFATTHANCLIAAGIPGIRIKEIEVSFDLTPFLPQDEPVSYDLSEVLFEKISSVLDVEPEKVESRLEELDLEMIPEEKREDFKQFCQEKYQEMNLKLQSMYMGLGSDEFDVEGIRDITGEVLPSDEVEVIEIHEAIYGKITEPDVVRDVLSDVEASYDELAGYLVNRLETFYQFAIDDDVRAGLHDFLRQGGLQSYIKLKEYVESLEDPNRDLDSDFVMVE